MKFHFSVMKVCRNKTEHYSVQGLELLKALAVADRRCLYSLRQLKDYGLFAVCLSLPRRKQPLHARAHN